MDYFSSTSFYIFLMLPLIFVNTSNWFLCITESAEYIDSFVKINLSRGWVSKICNLSLWYIRTQRRNERSIITREPTLCIFSLCTQSTGITYTSWETSFTKHSANTNGGSKPAVYLSYEICVVLWRKNRFWDTWERKKDFIIRLLS